jgi:hypothetical protein
MTLLAAAPAALLMMPANAALVDIVAELVDPVAEGWDVAGYDASALDTYRIYAVFDTDVSLAGVGDAGEEGTSFTVVSSDGSFFNAALGSDFAPNPLFTGTAPDTLWDTFVTIGEVVAGGPGGVPITSAAPDFNDGVGGAQANGLVGDFTLDDTGWYIAAFPPIADSDENGQILIAQFTVNQGVQIAGTDWRLSYAVGGEGGEPFDEFGSFVTPLPPSTLFVDAGAGGANTGEDWTNAFTELRAALAVAAITANNIEEIRVAAGSYTPLPGDRSSSFMLADGVRLQGGFPQGGGEAAERDPIANPTMLSGDLNGDDFLGTGFNTENSYHVLRADASVGPATEAAACSSTAAARRSATAASFRITRARARPSVPRVAALPSCDASSPRTLRN